MSLPPWRSDDPEERRALTRFIIAELDRFDASPPDAASEDQIRWLRKIVELNGKAKRIGLAVNLPESTGLETLSDFDRAALDVPRIRALFMLHWGKRNRTQRPLAEEIAADRWDLSAADKAKLIDKFQRKSSLSQR